MAGEEDALNAVICDFSDLLDSFAEFIEADEAGAHASVPVNAVVSLAGCRGEAKGAVERDVAKDYISPEAVASPEQWGTGAQVGRPCLPFSVSKPSFGVHGSTSTSSSSHCPTIGPKAPGLASSTSEGPSSSSNNYSSTSSGASGQGPGAGVRLGSSGPSLLAKLKDLCKSTGTSTSSLQGKAPHLAASISRAASLHGGPSLPAVLCKDTSTLMTPCGSCPSTPTPTTCSKRLPALSNHPTTNAALPDPPLPDSEEEIGEEPESQLVLGPCHASCDTVDPGPTDVLDAGKGCQVGLEDWVWEALFDDGEGPEPASALHCQPMGESSQEPALPPRPEVVSNPCPTQELSPPAVGDSGAEPVSHEVAVTQGPGQKQLSGLQGCDVGKCPREAEEEDEADGSEEWHRQQRLQRNRQSALQSRQRRKAYVTELEARCRMLEAQLNHMRQIVAMTAMENGALRDQVMRLQAAGNSQHEQQQAEQQQGRSNIAAQAVTQIGNRPATVFSPTLMCTLPTPTPGFLRSEASCEGVGGSKAGGAGAAQARPGAVLLGAEPAVLESDSLPSESLLTQPQSQHLPQTWANLHLFALLAASQAAAVALALLSLTSLCQCLPLLEPLHGPCPASPLFLCAAPPLHVLGQAAGVGVGVEAAAAVRVPVWVGRGMEGLGTRLKQRDGLKAASKPLLVQ